MRSEPLRRREVEKTASKRAPLPGKRTPKHGRGKLYLAGVPGNRGGTGRPPNWLRQRSRDLLEQLLDKLEQRVQGSHMSVDEIVRALAVTGKLGLPNQVEDSGPDPGPSSLRDVGDRIAEMLKAREPLAVEEEADALGEVEGQGRM